LIGRYASDPTIAVFRDLLIIWNIPELAPHCPDVYVVRSIRNKQQNRSRFMVNEEGVNPRSSLKLCAFQVGLERQGTPEAE
jgi:hypothetical protein